MALSDNTWYRCLSYRLLHFWGWRGQDLVPKLPQHAGQVEDRVTLDDLAVGQSINADGSKLGFFAGGWHAIPCATIRASYRDTGHDSVPLGDLLLDRIVDIRKGAAKRPDPLFCSFRPMQAKLRPDEVWCEDLVRDGEFTPAHDLLKESAYHCFVVFCCHRSSFLHCCLRHLQWCLLTLIVQSGFSKESSKCSPHALGCKRKRHDSCADCIGDGIGDSWCDPAVIEFAGHLRAEWARTRRGRCWQEDRTQGWHVHVGREFVVSQAQRGYFAIFDVEILHQRCPQAHGKASFELSLVADRIDNRADVDNE